MTRVVCAVVCVAAILLAVDVALASPPPIVGPDGTTHSPNVTVAEAGVLSTCAVDYYYAGYERNGIPGTGSSASAGVKWNTTTLWSGHVAGWVGVQNGISGSGQRWIQAGLQRSYGTSSISKYIEYNASGSPVLVLKGTASAGVVYNAVVTKVAAGSWTASIGGSGLGSNVSLSGMALTDFTGESQTASAGNCNVMDLNFSNSSTGTSSMTKIQDPPYVVDSVTSNGWRSHGG